MENIKEFIEKAVSKIKESPDLLKKFKADPKGTVKSIVGDLDENVISGIVAAVKEKLGDGNVLDSIKDKLGDSDAIDGVKDKLGGLFKKN